MPTATIDREQFLTQLEQVQPGLASREVSEQATCFAFKQGQVFTFNEEIACQAASRLPKDLTGAVQARPLLDILRRVPDGTLQVSNGGGRLVFCTFETRKKVKRKVKQFRVVMQKELLLPFDTVEKPEKWRPLPDDFGTAVQIVTSVVKKESSDWMYCCVHLHPDHLEASDGNQCVRYTTPTGLKKPVLVRGRSLRHVATLGVIKFAETPKWIHFKTREGTVLSCLRYSDPYELDIGQVVAERGKPATLPSGLDKAAEAAQVFASENDNKYLRVRLDVGEMVVSGIGVSGDYHERKGIKYKGKRLGFVIKPDLLGEIAKQYTTVEITRPNENGDCRLRVDGGKWVYVASLEREETNKDADASNDG